VKVYLDTMPNDFQDYLKAAFTKKKVPVVVVGTRDEAEFEIKGVQRARRRAQPKR